MNDKQKIKQLGGPAAVCELLGYAKDGGIQRVQNWKVRGIPSKVKLQFPHIFLDQAMLRAAAKVIETTRRKGR